MTDRSSADVLPGAPGQQPSYRSDASGAPAMVEKLHAAVGTAAMWAWITYLGFLFFGIYLAVIFGSTTHGQLLRAAPVALPFMGVELPLVSFYWIAPTLFVFLHFNLLIQLYLLATKLHALATAIMALPEAERQLHRSRVHPFPFAEMLIGIHHGAVERGLLIVLVWIILFILPILVLLLCQATFLPFHHAPTTWYHRCLILLDIALVWVLWPRILDPDLGRGQLIDWSRRILWPQGISLGVLSAISLTIAGFVIAMPGEFLARPLDARIGPQNSLPLIARNLAPTEKQFVLGGPSPGLIEKLGYDEAFAHSGQGLDLHGRDLRYAQLERVDLRLANLAEADLRQANLHGAGLQGVSFRAANLNGALLANAQLQDAFFWRTQLQGADLRSAKFHGAYMRRVELTGAWLWRTDFKGASLLAAKLRGTDLRWAALEGVDLAQADLQAADLREASLAGAILGQAHLEGADLRGADLQGADLRQAHLWRVQIDSAGDVAERWFLTDRRDVSFEPIEDVSELLSEVEGAIGEPSVRRAVLGRMTAALVEEDRPAAPTLPAKSPPTPDNKLLARFLGDLACEDADNRYLVAGIARRVALLNPEQTNPGLIAGQLLTECPAASGLSDAMRQSLKVLLPAEVRYATPD